MSVWPSVSQESPRNNGDGNSPAWGVEVEWQLINVQKIESKRTSYFWLLCLSGEESWVGKEGRRWIKGEQKAPGPPPTPTHPITPSFCARELVPRNNVWLFLTSRKMCMSLPGVHTPGAKGSEPGEVCMASWKGQGRTGRIKESACLCTALATSFQIQFPFGYLLFDLSVEKSGPHNAQIPGVGRLWDAFMFLFRVPCLRTKVSTVTASRPTPGSSWHEQSCITWTEASLDAMSRG